MEPQEPPNRGSYADIARTAVNNIAPWRAELAKISVFLLVDASFYEITKGIRQIEWNGAVDAIIPSGKGKWRLTFINQDLCDRFFSLYRVEGIMIAGKRATIAKNRALHVLHVEAENPLAPKMEIVEVLKEIGEVKRMEKVKNNGFWTGIWMVWITNKLKQRSISLRGPDYRVKVVDRHWQADTEPQAPPDHQETRNMADLQVSQGLTEIIAHHQEERLGHQQSVTEDTPTRIQPEATHSQLGEGHKTTCQQVEAEGISDHREDSVEIGGPCHTTQARREAQERTTTPRTAQQGDSNPREPGTTRLIQQHITEAFKKPQGKKGKQDKRPRKDTPQEVTVNVLEIPAEGLRRAQEDNSEDEDWMDLSTKRDMNNMESSEEQEGDMQDSQKEEQSSPPKKWQKRDDDKSVEQGTEKGCPPTSGGSHP